MHQAQMHLSESWNSVLPSYHSHSSHFPLRRRRYIALYYYGAFIGEILKVD
jgi:hypothetical protein